MLDVRRIIGEQKIGFCLFGCSRSEPLQAWTIPLSRSSLAGQSSAIAVLFLGRSACPLSINRLELPGNLLSPEVRSVLDFVMVLRFLVSAL